MEGERIPYNMFQFDQEDMLRYGFIRDKSGTVVIANRIFETVLYNYFLVDEIMNGDRFGSEGSRDSSLFIEGGSWFYGKSGYRRSQRYGGRCVYLKIDYDFYEKHEDNATSYKNKLSRFDIW